MPDLITHLASALIPGVVLRPHQAVLLALGTALPDLVGRLPGAVLRVLVRAEILATDIETLPFEVAHQPLGGVLTAALVARILPAGDLRRTGTALLVAGAGLHLGLDLLQDHHGYGYRLLAPFSTWRWEAALIGSEATVLIAPWLAILAAGVWSARWAIQRGRARSSERPPPPSD